MALVEYCAVISATGGRENSCAFKHFLAASKFLRSGVVAAEHRKLPARAEELTLSDIFDINADIGGVSMSDGPYRSLNMRPAWRKVARVAENPACTAEDIKDAAVPAICNDWRLDAPDSVVGCIMEVFGERQATLFPEQKIARLEKLLAEIPGNSLGRILVECAIERALSGKAGTEAATEAAMNALGIWGARTARQMEEFHRREIPGEPRQQNIRAKIEEGLGGVSNSALARQLLRIDPTVAPIRMPKKRGLDDGVRF